MAKVKNKVVASFLIGTMLLGTVSGLAVTREDTKVVYATSKAFINAQAKINHLVTSMQNNYLGIKNQGTWERYHDEAIALLDKVSKAEYEKVNDLADTLIMCEYLLGTLASVNQVEKSIAPKSEGGYGNYLGIKNAETWRKYLERADFYFYEYGPIDGTGIFDKQYKELATRKVKVEAIVKGIEDKFQIEYDAVVKLFNEAKASSDKEKARLALVEAEKLGTCIRSDKLERDIKNFINGVDEKEVVEYSNYTNYRYGFSLDYPSDFKKGYEGDNKAGCGFTFEDVEISAYGSNNVMDENGYSYYETMKDYGTVSGKILSENITETSIEVSFIKDGLVNHIKATVGEGSVNVLKTSYPESKSSKYEEIMQHVKGSFTTPLTHEAH